MTVPPLPGPLDEQVAAPPVRGWRRLDRRLLFLAVGAFNTVFGTAVFAALHLTVGHRLHYVGVLLVSHVVAVLVAFVLHRRLVFQVSGTGSVLVDLLRFESVYLTGLAVNLVALPVLVEVADLPVLVAQTSIVGVVVLLSWFGHKHWSFRRPGGAA